MQTRPRLSTLPMRGDVDGCGWGDAGRVGDAHVGKHAASACGYMAYQLNRMDPEYTHGRSVCRPGANERIPLDGINFRHTVPNMDGQTRFVWCRIFFLVYPYALCLCVCACVCRFVGVYCLLRCWPIIHIQTRFVFCSHSIEYTSGK